MTNPVAPYVYLLGLASGITLLAVTSYRHVSPRWLRWLLFATGLFVITRYISMALFTHPEAPERFWAFRHCWYATSVGLALPSVVAMDQLIKHPAMTPRKLLQWFSPFLLAYAAIILFGRFQPVPDPLGGWFPQLVGAWRWSAITVQTVFVVGFIALAVLFIRKIPSRHIRVALAGLVLAHLYLGFDGVLLALGHWYVRPFLYSEMLTLLALWHAFETSARAT